MPIYLTDYQNWYSTKNKKRTPVKYKKPVTMIVTGFLHLAQRQN